jgi:HEPN domain-containing protein
MSSPTDPQSWIDKAEEDYKIAQLTLRRKQPLTYGATYHAQQCGEKYLKALSMETTRSRYFSFILKHVLNPYLIQLSRRVNL